VRDGEKSCWRVVNQILMLPTEYPYFAILGFAWQANPFSASLALHRGEALVAEGKSGAVLVHLRVRRHGVEVAADVEVERVSTHQLAIGQARVVLLADGGGLGTRRVKDTKPVYIQIMELAALDLVSQITEDTACLEHVAKVHIAHHAGASGIDPIVLLGDSNDVSEGHALGAREV
jgi:hypothetical protein